MKVATHKVSKMDKARVNEGPRCVTEDDRLEFRDRKKDSELDKVGNELEPTRGHFRGENRKISQSPSVMGEMLTIIN